VPSPTATSTERPPVTVIGAGPGGLAAAAHLLERGLDPLPLEAGDLAVRIYSRTVR
jgi:cation diffusion facilitator CzcD-associated flavoprotein CzcO